MDKPVASGGMDNVIPQVPSWFIFVRYAQIVLTLVVFICSCVALSQFGGFVAWGAPFAIFTCIYTFIFLAGVLLVPRFATNFYFKWFCLGGECFAVLWWLCSFAGMATTAAWASLFTYDGITDLGSPGRTVYGASAAAAAFGAFTWVSFCVTLVCYAIGCHRARMQSHNWNGGAEAGAATSMGPIGAQQTGASQPSYDPAPTPVGYGYQGQQQQAPQAGYHQ